MISTLNTPMISSFFFRGTQRADFIFLFFRVKFLKRGSLVTSVSSNGIPFSATQPAICSPNFTFALLMMSSSKPQAASIVSSPARLSRSITEDVSPLTNCMAMRQIRFKSSLRSRTELIAFPISTILKNSVVSSPILSLSLFVSMDKAA